MINYTIFESNKDIYYTDGRIYYEVPNQVPQYPTILDLIVTPSINTVNVPVKVITEYFSENVFNILDVEYSFDNKSWSYCPVDVYNEDGSLYYAFYLDVYSNGTYYFRLYNAETEEYIYNSIDVNNIIYTDSNIPNYINGVFNPTPFLSYEYINDFNINVITQKFSSEELSQLECYYRKYNDEDETEEWFECLVRPFKDTSTGNISYQFYFPISNENGDGDGSYFVKFYNKNLDKYTHSSIEIIFQKIIEYQKELQMSGSVFYRFIDFFSDKFGFLVYPFELIVNILEKFNTINFSEPCFVIPDIYENTTGVKIISKIDFNFNDLLKNNILSNVHNIYLIIVDVVLIFGFVNFSKKVIMGVLEK